MSASAIDLHDLVGSLSNVALLVTWFVGIFLAAAAMRKRKGAAPTLALVACIVPIVGLLAGWGAFFILRSEAADVSRKFALLTMSTAFRALSIVISYAMLYLALFSRAGEE